MNLKGEIKRKALQMAVKWNADQFDLINNAFFGHLAELDGRFFAWSLYPTNSDIDYRAKSYWGQFWVTSRQGYRSLKVIIVMYSNAKLNF